MTSLVALDIETTGLDKEKDAIIQIGAVRFNERRIEDEWSTLVNPGRHIPSFITALTGINDQMVRQAPRLPEILPSLEEFIGVAPIVGHNIRFDLGFFARHGLFQLNEVIDTYELAAVLLPSASRYNLGALAQNLGIILPATHQALDDARVTHALYLRLYELARELPIELIAEFVRLSEPFEWDASWVFRRILRERGREPIPPEEETLASPSSPAPDSIPPASPPPQPVETPIPLDVDEIAAALEHGGPFERYFENFEYRTEQVEMLRAVTRALSESRHLMIEAGTGVGKSFAYLIPAAFWALQNNTRVVVSTNTINLQDQLIKKDIPDLCAALGLDLRAAVLKGRSNYLCPRRLETLRRRGPENADEMRVLAKTLVWLHYGGSGDRHEINLHGPAERQVWQSISAEDDACTSETCMKRTGGACPFYRARQAAQSAHILIVNHALLLSDVASGSRVLPEYQYLIVDEAHHLESATTNALSFHFRESDLVRMLRAIGGPKTGLLGRLLSETHQILRPPDFALLQQKVQRATDLAFRLENLGRDFFTTLAEFAAYRREDRPSGNYVWQERILPATRTLPGWSEVEIAWDAADETMRLLLNLLRELYQIAADLYANGLENLEDLLGDLSTSHRHLSEAEASLRAMISAPSPQQIYWIEVQPNSNRISLHAAPLHIGPLIQKYLWHEKESVILTSATLTTHSGFDYIRNTLSAEDADELALGSPFDYESATLLYLINDIPEPNTRGYQQAVERGLLHLCRATGGRTLALFTSYAQLKRTAQAISAPLAREDILVLEQGTGASPHSLLETFRGTERAVLLGTRSFWEGVDVPGKALSVLAIIKLPFDVPSDPIIAARSELYEDPFYEYYIPEAILKFRQGFGRLIRTQTDRGVVVLFDRRVQTKQYGRYFLEALPRCTVRVGPLSQLPEAAARWLGM